MIQINVRIPVSLCPLLSFNCYDVGGSHNLSPSDDAFIRRVLVPFFFSEMSTSLPFDIKKKKKKKRKEDTESCGGSLLKKISVLQRLLIRTI